jgi:hypothetical protein
VISHHHYHLLIEGILSAGGFLNCRDMRKDEQLHKYTNQYEFTLRVSKDVLGLAYDYGKRMLDEKEFDKARYFLEIVYGLTDDEEILELLRQLPNQ